MEFVEFGDIDMMLQYLKDVQAVQRKIAELSETIEFINEVCRESWSCLFWSVINSHFIFHILHDSENLDYQAGSRNH